MLVRLVWYKHEGEWKAIIIPCTDVDQTDFDEFAIDIMQSWDTELQDNFKPRKMFLSQKKDIDDGVSDGASVDLNN